MVKTVILIFLAGILGGNSFPHFVKGAVKEPYPNVFGGSPISNFITGWIGLVLTFILIFLANIRSYPLLSATSGIIGILLIGLFRARPGMFGCKPKLKL